MTGPPPFAARIARSFGASGLAEVLPATRLGGPMPWIVAIMVALTVLTTGGALALANFANQTRAGLDGGLTVQIAEADRAAREGQVSRAVNALRATEGVSEVRIVPEEDLATLVEPWLGDVASSGAVTMPTLIDVRTSGSLEAATMARLRGELARVAPAARLDRQADWLGPVFDTIRALRWLAAMSIVLLTLASAAAVWLASRNALDANRQTIEIVHHLGGDDRQITAIFQRAVLIDAAIGGIIGLGLGIAAISLLGNRFAALQSGMIESGSLSALEWLVIALVPVAMAVVALVTARRTVLARLGRML